METKKYVREVADDEIPVTLRSRWADRKALYDQLAPLVEDEIKTNLASMAKPYSKLANSVVVRSVPTGLIIEMDEYGASVDKGSRGRFLTDSIGKMVPIEKDDGRTIFRKVMPGAISRGKWYHPGTLGTHFVDVALERVISMAEGNIIK